MAKKLLALLLALIMVVGLVACSGNEDPTDPPAQQGGNETQPSEEQTEAPTMADPSTVHFTVAIETTLEDASQMPMFQMISEGTGYYPDYIEVSPAAASEQYQLMWMEDEIPNFITLSGLTTSDANSKGREGLIADLAPYITPELCPNMYKYLQESEWEQMTTSDGHIYFIGTFEDNYINKGIAMNMTWLKKLGLEVPNTPEELLEVWRAFKTQDPNGNGIADEIPFAFQQAKNPAMTHLWPMFAMFGEDAPCAEWQVRDNGEVYFSWGTESYKEGVKFFQQAYQEGLIDVENFTMDLNTFRGKCQGETCIYGSVTTFIYTAPSQSFTEERGLADYEWILPMINQSTGERNYINPGQYSSSVSQPCAISADTDPETIKHILKWVDYMYDPYIGTQLDQAPMPWGIYADEANPGYYCNGPTPGADFGTYTDYSEWRAAMHTQDLPKAITDYAENLRDWRVQINSSAIEVAHYERNTWYREECVLHNYLVQDAATEEEKEINSMYNSEFQAYWKNQMALWITTDADIDAEWDEYIENLNRLGLQELTEMKQAKYDRKVA